MEKQKDVPIPWKGCGTNREITGCRFSLSVMGDDYVNVIMNALGRVNTKKVWSGTDALSTVYRGKRTHVVDTVKACLVHVNDDRTHITMEATFSKGCPGDTDGDSFLAEDDAPANLAGKRFNVLGKISFYPMGEPQYMEHIAHAVNLTRDRGVFKNISHYATELQGDVCDVFDSLNEIMDYAENNVAHYVLQTTLSVNSPSLASRRTQ
ncbi:MAG: Ykof family thiamine-binding protein [Treponema sp.]|nr:Ykof family thiamine-binding protein [Treponema sp.]